MAVKFSREDIKDVGENTYQLGSVEFELSSSASKIGYRNVETEESRPCSIDDIRAEFGDEVASFLQEKLGK